MARKRVVTAQSAGAVTEADLRQTKILSVGHTRVQADGCRIERLVLREEAFSKTVPAAADLEQQFGRQQMGVRKGQDLHARRGHGIEAGDSGAAAQGQRETLVAVAIEITSGKNIRAFTVPQVMIDL